MKLNVSFTKSKQKNCGNDHHKYAIRGLYLHLPYAFAVVVDVAFAAVLFFYFSALIVWKLAWYKNETVD